MPVGMFRSDEGWVQVDYGTGNIPIPRSKYEENKYKPDFEKLPSEAEYWAAEKKKEDDAKPFLSCSMRRMRKVIREPLEKKKKDRPRWLPWNDG